METSLLAGQAVFTWSISLWLALGAIENVRHPKVNRDGVADVMSMKRMAAEYPDGYETFKANRTEDARRHALAFRAIVIAEILGGIICVAGAVALTLALVGLAPVEGARVLASWGAIAFTAIWSAFLVGGQWYHYWCGYESSQATHLAATIWGMLAFITLHL
ncbi:MAG: DUF2165 family protein [Pseudomonadota bacterium]